MALESGRSSRRRGSASTTRATGRSGPSGFAGTPRTYRGRSPRPPGARGAAENLDERFGDPGGPDPGEATSSAASASSMRERAAQELNPEMGRMGAEDPSTAFSAEPLGSHLAVSEVSWAPDRCRNQLDELERGTIFLAGGNRPSVKAQPDFGRCRMSNEAKGARDQAAAAFGLLDEPDRAEHRPRRRDRTRHSQPGVLPERGQVTGVDSQRVVLAFDQPAADIAQVGESGDFGRGASDQHT